MTITTVYKCDKCGNEQEDNNQFWTVGIVATAGQCQPSYMLTPINGKMIQVCRPCLESFGIHVIKKKDEEPPTPPSIEDLIGEIIELYQKEE